jgi:hypothetical protein
VCLYGIRSGGGDEHVWTNLGRAPQIMDNLIAQGGAIPMTVMLPNEHANQITAPHFVAPPQGGGRGAPANTKRGGRGAAQGASRGAARGGGSSMQGTAMLAFPKSIVTDLISFEETVPGHRAAQRP